MSKTEARPRDTTADDDWTAVGVRPLIYTNGSYRLTLTKAKNEVTLVEGEQYLIKVREDGSILLEPQ